MINMEGQSLEHGGTSVRPIPQRESRDPSNLHENRITDEQRRGITVCFACGKPLTPVPVQRSHYA